MPGNLLRHLQASAVFEVGGDPGRLRSWSGFRPPPRWPIMRYTSGWLRPRRASLSPSLPAAVRNSGPLGSPAKLPSGDIRLQVLIELVMGGDLVVLVALLVQSHPAGVPWMKNSMRMAMAAPGAGRRCTPGRSGRDRADPRASPSRSSPAVRRLPRPPAPGSSLSLWCSAGLAPVCAGFTSRTWPTTNQSKSIRRAARCCFTEGLDSSSLQFLDVGRHVHRRILCQLVEFPCPRTRQRSGRRHCSRRGGCSCCGY